MENSNSNVVAPLLISFGTMKHIWRNDLQPASTPTFKQTHSCDGYVEQAEEKRKRGAQTSSVMTASDHGGPSQVPNRHETALDHQWKDQLSRTRKSFSVLSKVGSVGESPELFLHSLGKH